MTVSVRTGAVWQPMPTGRLLYIRVGGAWKPVLDAWVRGNTPGPLDPLAGAVLVDYFNDTNNWTQVSGSSKTMVAGRTGQAVQLDAATGLAYSLPVAAQSDTVTVGFALKIASTIGTTNFVYLKSDSGATEHIRVTAGVSGQITVSRAGIGGATSANGVLTVGNWMYVEIQAKLSDTVGFVTVRVNGTQVINWTAADTKAAGTKTVWDTVQINGMSQTYGTYDDLYILNGGSFLGDIAALPAPPAFDPGWHKVADYSAPAMSAPTNLRMNPADVNAHNNIAVAWDWSQPTNGLPVGDFEVVLTNSGGGWLNDIAVAAAGRTYNFTGLNQNTQYQVYVRARYPGGGRAESAWAGPLRWKTGVDSYQVQDVAQYGWGGEYEWTPPFYYNYSSAANGDGNTWGFARAIDGNFSSYWNSDIVSEANGDGNQGEGWMVQCPGGHRRFNGIRMWTIWPHTTWLGIYAGGGWQGGYNIYSGKYGSWVHPYVYGWDQGAAGTNPSLRYGNWDIDAYGGIFVAGLMQYPGYDGYNWRMEVIELRLLLNDWTIVSYGYRTVAAVNSGYW